MKKSILNLVGAHELTKNEQKEVNGGAQNFCFTVKNPCNYAACRKFLAPGVCG